MTVVLFYTPIPVLTYEVVSPDYATYFPDDMLGFINSNAECNFGVGTFIATRVPRPYPIAA